MRIGAIEAAEPNSSVASEMKKTDCNMKCDS